MKVAEFDEFDLITGSIKDRKPTKTLHLEGKVFSAPYHNPDDRSVLLHKQVFATSLCRRSGVPCVR